MSVRGRILSASQGENVSGHIPQNIVREDAFHFIEWESAKGIDGIAFYVSKYAFKDFNKWRDSKIGKKILKKLHKAKYKNYLKCIFFDAIMRRTIGDEEESDIVYWTGIAIDVTFEEEDKEDILLFLFCTECCTLCTIQKRVTNLPVFDIDNTSECQQCFQHTRGFFP